MGEGMVGLLDGPLVGLLVGDRVGLDVGRLVGAFVGSGIMTGLCVGRDVCPTATTATEHAGSSPHSPVNTAPSGAAQISELESHSFVFS